MTTTTTDPLLQAARSYLLSKRITLWADFDLTQPERREAAAQWLAQQARNLAEHYDGPFYGTGAEGTGTTQGKEPA